jgi:hypothetical protein
MGRNYLPERVRRSRERKSIPVVVRTAMAQKVRVVIGGRPWWVERGPWTVPNL